MVKKKNGIWKYQRYIKQYKIQDLNVTNNISGVLLNHDWSILHPTPLVKKGKRILQIAKAPFSLQI
jgi:hypothetical protein